MVIDNEVRKALMERVMTVSGLALQVRSDFDLLSAKIKRQTDASLSSTTLRRFFGYQEKDAEAGCSQGTVNIICQYLGYRNLEGFCESMATNGAFASELMGCLRMMGSNELNRGDRLRIVWTPDRSMVIRYEGGGEVFIVEECINGKLMTGDTFHCHQFVLGEPLYCKFVLRKGMAPVDYVCGRNGGIRFEVLQ